MKRINVFLLLSFFCHVSFLFSQTKTAQISDIKFSNNGQKISVHFSLSGPSQQYEIKLFYSTNGGNTYRTSQVQFLDGHIVNGPGKYILEWKAAEELGDFESNNFRIKLEVWGKPPRKIEYPYDGAFLSISRTSFRQRFSPGYFNGNQLNISAGGRVSPGFAIGLGISRHRFRDNYFETGDKGTVVPIYLDVHGDLSYYKNATRVFYEFYLGGTKVSEENVFHPNSYYWADFFSKMGLGVRHKIGNLTSWNISTGLILHNLEFIEYFPPSYRRTNVYDQLAGMFYFSFGFEFGP